MKLNGLPIVTSVLSVMAQTKPVTVRSAVQGDMPLQCLSEKRVYNFEPTTKIFSWAASLEKSLLGAPLCHVSDDTLSQAKDVFLNHLTLSSEQHGVDLEEMMDFLDWDTKQDNIMHSLNVVKLYMRDQGHLDFSYDMSSVLLGLGRRKGALMTPDSDSWIRPYNDCFGTDIDAYAVSVFESNLLLMGKKSIISESLSTYISNVNERNIQDKMNELHSENEFLYITFLGDMTGIKPLESRLYAAVMLHQSYPELLKDWINLRTTEIDDVEYQTLMSLAATLQYTWHDAPSGKSHTISIMDNDGNLNIEIFRIIRDNENVKDEVLNIARKNFSERDMRGLGIFFDNYISIRHVNGPSTIPGGYLSAVRFTPDDDLLKHEVVEETLKRELGLYYSIDYAYRMVRAALGI